MPNVREALKVVEHWLGCNEETLSFGPRYDQLIKPSHEAATSGASQAEKALLEVRKLLDTVSFVAKEAILENFSN